MARIEILTANATDDQKALAVASALVAVASHGFDPWTAACAIFHVEAIDDLSIEDQPTTPALHKAVTAWGALERAIQQVCGPDVHFDIRPDPEDLKRELPWPRLARKELTEDEYDVQFHEEMQRDPGTLAPEVLQLIEDDRVRVNKRRAAEGKPLIPPPALAKRV